MITEKKIKQPEMVQVTIISVQVIQEKKTIALNADKEHQDPVCADLGKAPARVRRLLSLHNRMK